MIDPLLERFPEHRQEIERRLIEDRVFGEICEDYSEVQRMLVLLQQSPEKLTKRMIEDYGILLQELEADLLWALQRESPELRSQAGGDGPDIGLS